MRIRRVSTIAAVLVFSGALFASCGNDNKSTDNATTNTTAASSDTTAASAAAATVTIVATDFKFDQTTLTATAGQPVKFVIKNDSASTEHNLTIKDLNVNKDVEAGKSADATVTSPTPGTYEYHCEYHPAAMKGTLTVA